MKIKKRNRKFIVGKKNDIILSDKGSLYLNVNENISIHFDQQTQYDVAKKRWGFYPIPSINKRLKKFKLKAVLIENERLKTFFIMLVINKVEKLNMFKKYCREEDLKIVAWLDNKNLELIKRFFVKN